MYKPHGALNAALMFAIPTLINHPHAYADDPGAAAGGATGGAGGEGGGETPATPAPSFVTHDELASVINSALTNHTGRLEKKLSEGTRATIESAIAKALAAAAPKAKTETPSAESPEMAALRQKLDEMNAQLHASQEATAQATQQTLREKARVSVVNALGKVVRPEAVEDLADLFFARSRVKVDPETGQSTFLHKASFQRGMPEEDREFPIADGIAQWAKSASAAIYIPAPTSGNNGKSAPMGHKSGGFDFSKPAASEDEKLQRAEYLTRQIESKQLGS